MLPLPILNVTLNTCHEDWQQMTPGALGHHCAQCNRVVIDFTTSTQADLAAAFQNSPDGRVCGRFRPEQLAPWLRLRQKLRQFLVALVLVCGLGLSEQAALAQVRKVYTNASAVKRPKKTPVEKSPIYELPIGLEIDPADVIGILPLQPVSDPAPQADSTSSGANTPLPFGGVEQMPVYKEGGVEGMLNFISKNTRSPLTQGEGGRVFVRFIIDEKGRVRNPVVMKGLSPDLDAEAIRVVKLLGLFTPGHQNGQAVAVPYTLPIIFTTK